MVSIKPFTLKVRRWILALLLIFLLGVFVAQLMQIQIVDAAAYRQQLDKRQITTQMIKAVRGEIVDRDGEAFAVNQMGYDVVFDRAFLPYDTQNEIILRLTEMFETLGETWVDNLPVSHAAPFSFESGYDSEIARLKDFLGTQPYASADEVMYWLTERYGLEEFPSADARKIASVRYEMERRDFSNKIPYTFATNIKISSVIPIKEHGYELAGVGVVESAIRVYENGDVAPHLIGTVGLLYREEYQELKAQGKIFRESADTYDTRGYTMDDVKGKDGVELAFEDELRGHNGQREILFDSGGGVISAVDRIPPVPGNTVMLSIDMDLQRAAQQNLEAQIKFLGETAKPGEGKEATYGAAVMLDVKTGEVLAAATYPSFNLTTFRQDYASLIAQGEAAPLLNRAVLGQYTPGSIYKPVVGLAGLWSGVISPQSHVLCGRVYPLPGTSQRFTCMSAHGNLNLLHALELSCNIFFYDTGRRAGIDKVDEVARLFGLGEPTGIEIREAVGQRSNPAVKLAQLGEKWYEGDVLQSSIGQLFNRFTPLQMANFAAAIGNRGKRMKVTLVHEIRDYSMENMVRSVEPVVAADMNETIPPELFEPLVQGMVAASRTGTARGTFANYPVNVASKTGTPQVTETELNSTFICFAPAEDPQVAVAVVIEKGYHGYTGAPVAKALLDEYFGYEDVLAWTDSGPRRLQMERLAEKEAAQKQAEAAPALSTPAVSGQ